MELSTRIHVSPGDRWPRRGTGRFNQSSGFLSRAGKIAVPALICTFAVATALAAERVGLKDNDIVAFVGGADVAAAQHTGHLESLLTSAHPTVRFRNFGWEGDTVFAQPRDYNFPPLAEHIRKAGVTLIFVQFGRMEAFAERNQEFQPAYEKLLDTFSQITPRLVLVTPVPFETPPAPLPDLAQRNSDLQKISATIRDVGNQRKLPVLDLFSELNQPGEKFTEDGQQVSPKGQAIIAQAFARQLGIGSKNPLKISENSAWQDSQLETLRQAVIAKNRLWFDYWRPQNWAFLGGDRIEQPSSRDHRDPKIRWFPQEMQKFEPLIAKKENEIATLARQAARLP